jgi:hypothetical protein
VIKHRQLVRQVGAFGATAIESSTDLKINAIRGNLIFHNSVSNLTGSTSQQRQSSSSLRPDFTSKATSSDSSPEFF